MFNTAAARPLTIRIVAQKVRQLLAGLKSASTPAQRQQLLGKAKQELEVHTTIEEEIFYPAFRVARTKKDRQLFYEATAEHHAADLMLRESAAPTTGRKNFRVERRS